jgi:hypothetical protein
MSFISQYLQDKIAEMVEKLLEKNNFTALILEKPVYAVQGKRSWKVVGVNDFGFVILERQIAISFSLVPGPEMIKIYEQIKSGKYELHKKAY